MTTRLLTPVPKPRPAVGGGGVVEPVNFNGPGQTVIAGSKAAVERACEACKARGAKRAVLLPVSAPFHSSLIRPAADKLAARLAQLSFATPHIPVINNADVAIESDPERIKDSLVRQAYSPVRWVETIRKMAAMDITTVVECGPGKVLAGLTKRCADGLTSIALADLTTIEATSCQSGGRAMLNGQIALVTGASRGIGQAIALELGALGATVIGTATSPEGAAKISAFSQRCGEQGRGLHARSARCDSGRCTDPPYREGPWCGHGAGQ
jgi:acyl transferase domain-containing protein